MTFSEIHEAGAKRHPDMWIAANIAAVHAANYERANIADSKTKALVSHVVLSVLDALKAKP